jgi:hypothetical protein
MGSLLSISPGTLKMLSVWNDVKLGVYKQGGQPRMFTL